MHARDRLHHPAVAMRETHAVHMLHPPDIRRAVARDRNTGVALDRAGHAGCPQQLVPQVPVYELVQIAEELHQLPALMKRRGDELDQRLGVIGGDDLVGESRPQRGRMRRLADLPVWPDPKRLLLDALQSALEGVRGAPVREPGQSFFVFSIDRHAGLRRRRRDFCDPAAQAAMAPGR